MSTVFLELIGDLGDHFPELFLLLCFLPFSFLPSSHVDSLENRFLQPRYNFLHIDGIHFQTAITILGHVSRRARISSPSGYRIWLLAGITNWEKVSGSSSLAAIRTQRSLSGSKSSLIFRSFLRTFRLRLFPEGSWSPM
jgi:hypothetical protein